MELGPWTQSATFLITCGVAIAAAANAFAFAPDADKMALVVENGAVAALIFGVRTADIIRARRKR